MAQQFIDFGTFPNDPAADPLRAAFQKIQDNFTEIYNTTTAAGVVTLTAGAGLKQFGGTSGNILIIANIPSITIQTSSSLLVGVGAATSNTATITSSTSPFKLDLASNITTTNANFTGLTRTSNLQVANFVTSSLVPNANITYDLGSSNLRWRDLYLSGSTLYLGAQTIGANASGVSVSNLLVSSNITVGNISATGNISSNNATISNNITTSNISVSRFVGSSLRPQITDVYDLGNSTYRWKSLVITNTGITVGTQTITGNATSIIISGTTSLSNVTATNANLGNAITGNYFVGNGAYLTYVPVANLSGQVANSLVAGTVYSGLQPNITAVGTLSSLTVNGNLNSLTNLNAANLKTDYVLGDFLPYGNETQDLGSPTRRWRDLWISGNSLRLGSTTISSSANGTTTISGGVVTSSLDVGTVTSTYLGGTLTNSSQPNITEVGVLSNLAVAGSLATGELSVVGNLTAVNMQVTNAITVPTIIGNVVTPAGGVVAAPGNSTQLLFNDGGNTAAVPGMTFNTANSLLTIQGNVAGGNLSSSGGLSVSGNATLGNVSTTGISATGNVSSGNVISLGIISATGNVAGGNLVSSGVLLVTGNATVGNITTTRIDGTLVSVSGNVSGANLVASGALSVQGSATVGSLISSQANIDSLITNSITAATLSGTNISANGNVSGANLVASGALSVTGTATVGGISTTGNATIGNISTAYINSNSVVSSGNVSGANLVASGILSVQGGASVGSLNSSGTAIVNLLQANGNVSGDNLSANGLITAGSANVSGNLSAGNVSGSTFTATLFSGNGASISFINGSNVSGLVANAGYATLAATATNADNATNATNADNATNATNASTVTGASQPNITSLGTLTGLTVSGAFSGANISASGYVLASVAGGVAAAGTNLAGAAQLSKQINVVTSVATGSADGIKLPAGTTGMQIIIVNTTVSAVKVYPQSGAAIDALGASNAFPLGGGARLMVIAANTTQWYTMVGVYG